MNLTMTVTLDGLIRALRWKEHDLVEKIERRAARRDVSTSSVPAPRRSDSAMEDDDDSRGR
jgi:hypothetical protein